MKKFFLVHFSSFFCPFHVYHQRSGCSTLVKGQTNQMGHCLSTNRCWVQLPLLTVLCVCIQADCKYVLIDIYPAIKKRCCYLLSLKGCSKIDLINICKWHRSSGRRLHISINYEQVHFTHAKLRKKCQAKQDISGKVTLQVFFFFDTDFPFSYSITLL